MDWMVLNHVTSTGEVKWVLTTQCYYRGAAILYPHFRVLRSVAGLQAPVGRLIFGNKQSDGLHEVICITSKWDSVRRENGSADTQGMKAFVLSCWA